MARIIQGGSKMRFKNHKHSLSILTLTAALFCLFSGSAFGQTEPTKSVSNAADQIASDENFELNITQNRITETSFSRSTRVELSDAGRGGLRVEVGVGVRAESIDVLLRGIFGRVRFRASLEPLRLRLEQLQTTKP